MREYITIEITTRDTTTLTYRPDRDHHGTEKSLEQIAADDIKDIESGEIDPDELRLSYSESETKRTAKLVDVEANEEVDYDVHGDVDE